MLSVLMNAIVCSQYGCYGSNPWGLYRDKIDKMVSYTFNLEYRIEYGIEQHVSASVVVNDEKALTDFPL